MVVNANASRLANSVNIMARIAELEAKVESDAIGTVSERKKRLTDIYRAQMVDFISPDGEPQLTKDVPYHKAASEFKVSTRYTKLGEKVVTKSIKLIDPVAAIEAQNKMERIGAQDTAQGDTNNYYNIAVISPEADTMLKRLLAGERTDRELPGG